MPAFISSLGMLAEQHRANELARQRAAELRKRAAAAVDSGEAIDLVQQPDGSFGAPGALEDKTEERPKR